MTKLLYSELLWAPIAPKAKLVSPDSALLTSKVTILQNDGSFIAMQVAQAIRQNFASHMPATHDVATFWRFGHGSRPGQSALTLTNLHLDQFTGSSQITEPLELWLNVGTHVILQIWSIPEVLESSTWSQAAIRHQGTNGHSDAMGVSLAILPHELQPAQRHACVLQIEVQFWQNVWTVLFQLGPSNCQVLCWQNVILRTGRHDGSKPRGTSVERNTKSLPTCSLILNNNTKTTELSHTQESKPIREHHCCNWVLGDSMQWPMCSSH